MKESSIVRKIQRFLSDLPDSFVWKTHDSYTVGIPDIVACIRGRFVGFEVKTATGRPSKIQLYRIRQIREAGGIAAVVRSVEEVESILKREGLFVENQDGER